MSASNSQYLSGSFLNNYNFVHNNLNQIVDKHVAMKLVIKQRSLPWLNDGLVDIIKNDTEKS